MEAIKALKWLAAWLAAFAALPVSVALIDYLGGFGVAVGFLITAFAIIRLYDLRSSARNLQAINAALPMLDCVVGGRRFVGTESVAIATRRVDKLDRPGPLILEQLCRTRVGQWFKLSFQTDNGTGYPFGLAVQPISENEAKNWLEQDPDIYRRFFGEPEIA
ncbi:hypothetical protein EZJ19_07730 [Parasulfuritortus cantonensis]|uniref:Uncharacterized protein n=1 Tax=Parasulfuritortus cantonensis TaxID=2528202 RepID=A0A4R1BDN1_9PROT|nr:hypothetical protein [Parasulfuritortus cantonensis]TCJ15190.1 hypothetical protein EZJ19_07730 [Parasulfuritortus cantonensis]